MSKVNVTCRMDEERVAGLDKLGQYYDRDRSYLINQAVDRFLSYHQWQLKEVEKAIAEADAGELLTEKEFDAEMKKWRK
jgi:RHH-type rel operon transcriptional repressor/antitoxin RelB